MTARNLQDRAKKAGLPWTFAKGFDTFLPISPLITPNLIKDPQDCQLKLFINNQLRQDDNTNLMVFKIPYLLAYVSNIMTLNEGDVILTGTPKGVGETKPGDKLHAELYSENKLVQTLSTNIESTNINLNANNI
ncbi:hypothetical protein FF38_08342 [Lucilia cuprina]|uniref:oxaloacetate tautomerase n=1 Tax=Lucilia cuprina TaxID=7375 RepID=A0A0L0CPX3_LUCCU|nr:putative hydrolase C21C3.09c [Lucilia cuprina]KNC34400.1 hypothetical protein FF38_08342 [Lucilia cuprina]